VREAAEPTELRHDDRLVALDPGPRVVAAETGDGRVHEARVVGRELVVAEPEPFRDTRAPRLHDDVGAHRERSRDALVVVILEVEDDAALAAAPERPRRLAAQRMAAGRLDLDHLRAEIGEELADVVT